MFIWKYVDIDPREVSRIQKSFMKVMPLNFNFFQPLRIDTDEFMGMKIKIPVLIQTSPYKSGQVHVDIRYDNNTLALQIPLINCENSVTEFWEANSLVKSKALDSDGIPYQFIPKENCKKIDEFVLTKPIIFRTDIPHSVTNRSNSFRKAISLRFYDDPWHLVDTV
jgi:hypothetical protein